MKINMIISITKYKNINSDNNENEKRRTKKTKIEIDGIPCHAFWKLKTMVHAIMIKHSLLRFTVTEYI